MFRLGQENLIFWLEILGRIAVSHEVQAASGPAREDDFRLVAMDEFGNRFTGAQNHLIHGIAKVVIPAVGIRGFFRVIIRDGLDDRVWFEGRGSIV